MSETLTYVYCLVRSAKRPSLRERPPGMPGANGVRALDAGGGVWAIVSSVPARGYDEAALAGGLQNLDWVAPRALAHESVVESFLTAPAVLPMQLFTLFTSDERALGHVARDRTRIDRIFARIERQLEWGLRLSFDESAARQAVETKHRTSSRTRQAGPSGSAAGATSRLFEPSGVAYLARKRDLLDVMRVQLTEAKSEANRLYRAMSREATQARRRTAMEQGAPGSRLILDAAFLVPARRAGAFRSALRQNARKISGTGVVIALSGPWPPYNFIDPPSRDALRRDKSASAKETVQKPPRDALRQDKSASAKETVQKPSRDARGRGERPAAPSRSRAAAARRR